MVILNGQEVGSAQFAFNSVLTWADAAGYNAWLQFMVLPGGPAFVGKLHRTGENDVTGACLFSCMFKAHKALPQSTIAICVVHSCDWMLAACGIPGPDKMIAIL